MENIVKFEHPCKSSIREDLQEFLESGFLCDIRLICGTTIFKVHKFVLRTASQFLSDILREDINVDTIFLPNYDEEELSAFVEDLYGLGDGKVGYWNILNSFQICDKNEKFTSNYEDEINKVAKNINEVEKNTNYEEDVAPTSPVSSCLLYTSDAADE